MKMRLRKEKKFNFLNGLVIILLMIISLTAFFFRQYSLHVCPKLIEMTKFNIDKFTNKAIVTKFDKDVLKEIDLDSILMLTKNSEGEIVTIDYNLENTYALLAKWINELTVDMQNLGKIEIEYYDSNLSSLNNSIILSYPMGLASDSLLLNNLGPRIPIKINLLNNVMTNVHTKVSDYGINALLVEMYVIIDLKHQIIGTSIEDFSYHYEILIASKLIQGKIPTYYGGVIERNSNVVS